VIISLKDIETGLGEPELHLLFVQDRGGIWLAAEDGRGTRWFIAKFTSRGMGILKGIPPSTGWPLDKDGRLCIYDLVEDEYRLEAP
jgi:hypothetical protein